MRRLICVSRALLFAVILFSCADKQEKVEHEYLKGMLAKIELNPDYKWVVVLPGLGCHGCIVEAEYFMKQNIDNSKILFLLTNSSSIKILQQKIGLRLSGRSNVYIDKEKIYQLPTENSIYPCVIELDNGDILKHSFQSPTSAAIYQLEKMI